MGRPPARVLAVIVLVGCSLEHSHQTGDDGGLDARATGDGGNDAFAGPDAYVEPADAALEGFVPDAWISAVGPGIYVKASNTHAGDGFSIVAISADGSTIAVGAPNEDDSASNSGAVYVFVRSGSTWVQQAYLKASNADADDAFGFSVALSADGSRLAAGAWNEHSSATGLGGDPADDSLPGAGAVYVFTRTGTTWAQEAYVKASDTEQQDAFGYAVALSGDGTELAVGAPGQELAHPDVGVTGAGAVYVFERGTAGWAQTALLKSSNPFVGGFMGDESSEGFGGALALSGDGATLAVGASQEHSTARGIDGDQTLVDGGAAGAVFVFARSGSTWTQEAYVKQSNTRPGDGDLFSYGVALSYDGSVLAVGAPGEDSASTGIDGDQDDTSATAAGAVYVFERAGATWSQVAYVKASNTTRFDAFGTSVALSPDGATLAVGAPDEGSLGVGVDGDQTPTDETMEGAVYVFRDQGAWRQVAYVKAMVPTPASTTLIGARFGQLVGLASDGTLVVSAPSEASSAVGIGGDQTDRSAPQAGAVYVF